jgi:hypothetical protein
MALLIVIAHGSPVHATTQNTPQIIVEEFYKPYLADPQAKKLPTQSSLDLILLKNDASLKQAIHKEMACQKREHGICNIGFDIIVNAQDWNLSEFSLGPVYKVA